MSFATKEYDNDNDDDGSYDNDDDDGSYDDDDDVLYLVIFIVKIMTAFINYTILTIFSIILIKERQHLIHQTL